jgi:hypothetical protein
LWKCWNCFSSKEEKVFKQLKWMKFINQHEIVCSSFFARFCFLSLSFNSLLSFSFVLFIFSVSLHISQFLFILANFSSCFQLFVPFSIFFMFSNSWPHLTSSRDLHIILHMYLLVVLFTFQLRYLSILQLFHVLMSSLNSLFSFPLIVLFFSLFTFLV